MQISSAGRAWIKHSEGFSGVAYVDAGGMSIGYGHHIVPPESFADGVTSAQADALLDQDIAIAESAVNRMVNVQLTQGQFDAMVDLTYNEGASQIGASSLVRCLNTGDYTGARKWFYWVESDGAQHGWIYADGEISTGLVARRKGDQVLWDGGNPLEGQ